MYIMKLSTYLRLRNLLNLRNQNNENNIDIDNNDSSSKNKPGNSVNDKDKNTSLIYNLIDIILL